MRLVMTMVSAALFRRVVVATAVLLAVGAAYTDTARAHQPDGRLSAFDLSIDSEYNRIRGQTGAYWEIIVENNVRGPEGVDLRLARVEIVITDAVGATSTTIWTIRDLPAGGSVSRNIKPPYRPGRLAPVRLNAEIIEIDPVEPDAFHYNNATEHWGLHGDGTLYENHGDAGIAGVGVADRFPRPGGATTFTVHAKNFAPADGDLEVYQRNSTLFDVQVEISLSPGLAFAGMQPPAATSTTFDASTGIWNVGTLRARQGVLTLPVAVTLSGDSLADLPLEERCLTAEVVSAVPSWPSKRDNDTAIWCLGEFSNVLLTSGEIVLFYPYDCVGITAYPCSSADTLELVARAEQRNPNLPGFARPGLRDPIYHIWLRPEEITVHVPVHEGRLYDRLPTSVTDASTASWHTGRDDSRGPDSVEGVEIKYTRAGFNARIADWSNFVRTVTVSGLNGAAAPGRVRIRVDNSAGFVFYDPNPTHRRTPFNLGSASTVVTPYFLEFSALGTYVVEFKVDAVRSDTAMTTYTGAGAYTFHVGPVADLELKAAWDAPGVLVLTALNHGPDEAPAAQVTVTPPPELRFARGEASQGSYDPAPGVWDIGTLKTPGYRRAVGLPEGATLTLYTEPAANTGTPDQMVTASIENTQDYCVRIKTGDTDAFNDLECVGDLPSGYTQHSASYYDYRPDNNEVALPADWTAAQLVAATRLTGLAITSEGGYQPGDDIEVTATFNQPVRVNGQPRLRLRVGEVTREAALHSSSGDTIVFRYRVRDGDSDTVDGVSIPPGPFVLPPGAGIAGPGGGRVSLFFAGLEDQAGHRVYPDADRVEGTNVLVWSPPEDLYTGVDGARYRLFDRMRHYYRYNDLTRRWEIEFRIADAGLDAPDLDLIQWLVLRASGYYITRPHIYGAAPVEMKPWLGGWADDAQHQQQVCAGLKAEFSPGKTREQRLEELRNVEIAWIARRAFGEYGVQQGQSLYNLLGTAQQKAAEEPCPDPPAGVVTIQGQASTRGPLGAVLSDPNGVVEGSETWQWKRSPDGTTHQNVPYTGFNNIPGATGPSYTPGAEDAGRWLRVKATYTDGQRATRTAFGQSEGPVTGRVQEEPPPQQQPAGQTVPADSPLVPEGIEPGDSFRLLFVTSTTTTAESADIADYNRFVQTRAAVDSNLAGFSGQFRALISTASVNVKDNSATTGTGVPVHWLGGERVADDYADLYDGDWDSVSGKTETGNSYTGLVWTGGNGRGETSGQRYAGAAEVRMGDLSDATKPLSSPAAKASSEAYPLYALSPVITVAEAAGRLQEAPPQQAAVITGLELGSAGPYGAGDAISVGVVFSREVTVAGTPELSPKLSIEVGGERRTATYDAAQSVPGVVAFSYTVRESDSDADGVSVYPGSIVVPEGASIRDDRGVDAELAHSGLAPQPGHTVDGSLEGQPVRQQQAANSPPQFASENATLSVNENAAAGTNVGRAIVASDADGDALTYTLTGSDAFTIGASSGQITLQSALDYETQASYSLSVTVSDGKNAAGGADPAVDDTIAVTVNVGNVDEPGSVSLDPQAPQAGSAVSATLSDPDGSVSGQTWSWARSADQATWETIGGATGAAYTPSGDDADYYLRATAGYTDGHGPGKSAASAATAGAVAAAPAGEQQQQASNSPPAFAAENATLSVNEDAAVGANAGNAITAADADGDALTYALTGSGAFAINSGAGQITVKSALDYETTASYSLTVTVSDGKNAAGGADPAVDDAIAVTVNVGNVDEAGSVSLDPQAPQAGSAVSATLSDPDGGVSGQTWSWASSTDQTNWTAITGAAAQSYTPSADDVGSYLRATAGYTDGHGPGKMAQGATAAPSTPEPEPAITAGPVITSSPKSGDTYGEGEAITVAVTFSKAVTVTGGVRVRLAVGERQRWARYDHSKQDGTVLVFAYKVKRVDADADGVSIGANQLQLRGGTVADSDGNAASLDHPALADQSGHKVDGSQEATPAGQQQQQQASNSPPAFATENATRSVNEDAAVGANVGGAITATDADNDALTYALTGSGAFAIDASGQITVKSALDYETGASYALTVSVSDGKDAAGGADTSVDDSIAVTVSVGNVDEAGTVSFDAGPPQVGSPLTARLSDPDGGVSGETWTWQVSAGGTTWAAIDGASGASYTPSADDVGSYLRATVSYADGHGSGKSAAAATASAVEPAPAAQRQQAPTVPADSPLVPKGIGPGDSFRLLFVTSTTTGAASADIADYNGFVQSRAAANTNLADFSNQFTAYISTSAVSARDNTGTTGEGVPIHWLGGEKVANDYADLYDGDWDSVSGTTEGGGSYTGLVWTGGNKQGEKSGQRYAGAAEVRMGDLGDAALAASSPTAKASSEAYPLYALSPVITVAQPE